MSGRLSGKTCVVTGAGQGIGLAIARSYLREGAVVWAIDRQWERLDALGGLDGAGLATIDVTDPAAVLRLAQEIPQASVLVNCVGMVAAGTVLDCDEAEFEHSFRVNVVTMLTTIRAFLPRMRQRRDGSIVNIASVASTVKGLPDRCAYGTTKGAVIALTKSVARDFITEGVRCNAISPGTVMSPSLAERIAAQGDVEAATAAFVARQPIGRLGAPEEIAEVAVLLASDEARFMTGENIVIDGGVSL